MKRYKVALVCDWYLPRVGGLEVQIRDLAAELSARGHEVHVICTTPAGPRPDSDSFRVIRLDVSLVPVLNTIGWSDAVVNLEQLFRNERYDVVHAHTAYSVLAVAATCVAKRLGIPSVYTEHSVLRGAGSWLFRAIDMVYPWTTWPTIMSAVSGFVAEDLRRISGRDDVQVLVNAIRPEQWSLERKEELRVTCVTRFVKRKRPMDMVRMVPLINAKLPPELRPKFTFIGDGPERPRVEREAQRLGVSEYTEFTGVVPRSEIKKILARSAVFILPSYKEAMSIAVVEARAAGVPVVARTPNGVSEVIEHGVQGFLAPTTEEFVDYVVQLVQDPALRARFSANCRRNLDRFTWESATERHEKLYALAIQRTRQLRGELVPVNMPVPEVVHDVAPAAFSAHEQLSP